MPSNSGCEILCIGTELLLGNILNGNARWLAEQLAVLGLPHYRQSVVGDNPERLRELVLEASERCRVLICTGGLGPTPDDLTTETLAASFSTPLELRPEVLADIKTKLQNRGRRPDASNDKQALLPVGAKLLPNPTGTAPGMIWTPRPGFTLLTFPGVPAEMRAMWEQTAAPWLQQQGLARGTFCSRQLHFWGIGESRLAEQVAPLLELGNPTVAPYAGLGEVKLRITASAENAAAAKALIAPVEQQLRQAGGDHCYGADADSLASVVLDALRRRNQTLSVAESCTGGGIGAALTAISGSSDVLLGGVIAYANRIKQELLGVPAELLEQEGAVSAAVVSAMASGARRRLGSDWAIAVSGIAGPGGGSAEKPVGLVHIAVAGPDGITTLEQQYGASRGRDWIRSLTVGDALNLLRLQLA
ncbi:MAG: competence/damage-inducible protein A [Synechococcus sp.]|nr:competence/damage-inducible protein A [Synechococcus sp.]